MSILTKVLIVLLAFSSLFLCGMVVVYVGTADNYKEMYDKSQDQVALLRDKQIQFERLAEESNQLVQMTKQDYEQQIQDLQAQLATLTTDLKAQQRESLMATNRADKYQGLMESYGQTLANLEQTLKATQAQLDRVREQGISDQKELNEVTASLYEKIVQLQALEADKRRLLEEKRAMEEQMANGGGVSAAQEVRPNVVTPERTNVTAAPAAVRGAALNGLVREVSQNMATISLGSADGVREGMKFHITRGDEFISDLVITHVDTNMAAGALELKMQQPRIGDNVSTSL